MKLVIYLYCKCVDQGFLGAVSVICIIGSASLKLLEALLLVVTDVWPRVTCDVMYIFFPDCSH